MHLFIKKYVEVAKFEPEEWDRYLSKENLLESAILRLIKILNKHYEQAEKLNEEEIDQALLLGHEDADIFLFFITLSIVCLTQHQQLEKAKSLVSIGNNLTNSNMHPVIHSFYLQGCSRLKFFYGELEEEKRLMETSLRLIKRDSPKYKAIFINYSFLLARSGKLKDLNAEDEKILREETSCPLEKGSLANEICLADCIVRGDYEKGFGYLTAYHRANEFKITSRYENALLSLKILSRNRELTSYPDSYLKDFAIIFDDFYESRWLVIADKMKKILSIEATNPFVYFISKYLCLHYELSNKNSGKAKLILIDNLKKGKAHFLDDLFYARIALIEGKRNDALYLFKRLMLNVQKYGFMHRLEFELQFAKEISSADLFYLLQKANEFKDKNLELEEKIDVLSEKDSRGLDLIVGSSASIEKVKILIQKFAMIAEPILITGETGTGKELVAKAVHDIGAHSKEPFLAINCGALTDTLLQSELFGYEAGAFTGAQKEKKGIFEAAGRGTVFLDEFEDVSPKMQSSLLRVLETNEIRLIGGTKSRIIFCKIVIATNVSLKTLVAKKSFRDDLYFRLARYEIKLPALKARKADIPELIQLFLSAQNEKEFSPLIDADLLKTLVEYDWPGNIRELRNVIERMKTLHPAKNIYGNNEFEFDQLENFTEAKKIASAMPKELTQKAPSFDENSYSSEEERIQGIVSNGFKIESRQQFLKTLFIKYKKLSRSQVKEILKVNPITAANDLQALSDEGFIIKKTPTKSTKSHYFELKE
jgi:transcriptional regulator with PAS, ATPase and Fis domain